MGNIPFLFGTPWPWWSIVLTGAGVGYLTWRGYRRRRAEVKAPRLRVLKFLRLSGWTLLIVCLLQPAWRESLIENKASRLALLVDDSESMSFADSRSGPSRLERVRQTLLGDAAQTPKGQEPKLDSRALLSVLARNFQVQLEAFGPGARSVARQTGLAEGLLQEVTAQAESTDLAKSLGEAFSRLKGPDASGLVLVSDGGDTQRGDVKSICAQFKRFGTPIYVLGVGEEHLQDISIAQVRCRRTVSKDTLARVEVDVRRTGFKEPSRQLVTLRRDGRSVGEPVILELKADTATAVFQFLPDSQGFLEYEAHVEPLPDELVIANNTLRFGLVAFSRKLRVLYMEGSMYLHRIYDSPNLGYTHVMQGWWEHQFLERALTEDLDVEVDVLAKEAFGVPQGAQHVTIPTVKEGYPKTKKELYQYDVIISSDIPYTHFSEEQVQWTVDFVAKHGGGFCMIGGYDAFGEGKYARTAFDRMLPVQMKASDKHVDNVNSDGSEVRFHFKLTDEAWSHPLMQLEKTPDQNRSAWERLPTFRGFSRTMHRKGAATLLAVVDEDMYDEFHGKAILLAVQPFGRGRSMAFTTDSTGSWGTEWEDTWGPAGDVDLSTRNQYFKTFWKNAVRWLAEYRMKAPNQLVLLETERLVYGRGEQPEIRARVMNEDYEFTHDASVSIAVSGPDGQRRSFTLFPRYDEPGVYERKIELPALGRYEIEALASLKKEELGRDKAILQVRPATAEMRQLGQNVALLKHIAEESGGVYLPLEKASELPQYLREATHVIEKHRDHDLWDRGWIFALIVTLLCGEWFLRKRSGLP